MNTSPKQRSNKAKTTTTKQTRKAGASQRPERRPPRPKIEPLKLSRSVLQNAVLQVLYLAVEYEQRDELIEDDDPDRGDRKIRQAMHEMTEPDVALQEIVEIITRYNASRQSVVRDLQVARALREIIDIFEKERDAWEAGQKVRKKGGFRVRAWQTNSSFKDKLRELARERLQFWFRSLNAPDAVAEKIVAVFAKPRGRASLLSELAEAVRSKLNSSAGRTIEGYAALMSGRAQAQGRVRDPVHAQLGIDDDRTLPGTDVLRYVLRIIAAGRTEDDIEDIVEKWSDAGVKILARRVNKASGVNKAGGMNDVEGGPEQATQYGVMATPRSREVGCGPAMEGEQPSERPVTGGARPEEPPQELAARLRARAPEEELEPRCPAAPDHVGLGAMGKER